MQCDGHSREITVVHLILEIVGVDIEKHVGEVTGDENQGADEEVDEKTPESHEWSREEKREKRDDVHVENIQHHLDRKMLGPIRLNWAGCIGRKRHLEGSAFWSKSMGADEWADCRIVLQPVLRAPLEKMIVWHLNFSPDEIRQPCEQQEFGKKKSETPPGRVEKIPQIFHAVAGPSGVAELPSGSGDPPSSDDRIIFSFQKTQNPMTKMMNIPCQRYS